MKKSTIRIPGFSFAGISAGIKATRKKDLALIVSDRPAKAVAMFTTNLLKAAPVLQGEAVMKGKILRAVVINSGNANAATGPRGLKDAWETAACLGRALKISPKQILVSSTGKIGVPLPMPRLRKGIPLAVAQLSPTHFAEAAEAIRTTDAFAKFYCVKGRIGTKTFHIAGLAKGAGMIEPRLATMLAFLLTDLDLQESGMRSLFREVVEETFNSVTVDGDTSTNDTALLLANGASGIPTLRPGSPGWKVFRQGLLEVCQNLSRKMVLDGEGATKLVELHITGAKTDKSAKKIAFSIARSQLVKTSFFGEDPNWGRVFAAAGYSGETFDPSKVDIYYGPIPLVRRGVPLAASQERKAHRVMRSPSFQVTVCLNQGRGQAKVWTSDLGYRYVKINAEYRT